ncbi:MAG: hypothetical protein ABR600_05640, partial [Actinomycetota bacterium]
MAENALVSSVAVDGSGRIVVGGTVGRRIALVRYLDSGRLDRSFGTRGRVLVSLGAGHSSMAESLVLPSGKILVAGTFTPESDPGHIELLRLLEDGRLDRMFGTEGRTTVSVDPPAAAHGLTRQPDHKILVLGAANGPSPRVFQLIVAR